MNHINPMFKSDADDIFLGKVCSNGSQPPADLICFIGLIGI